jgi:hypothetical protein
MPESDRQELADKLKQINTRVTPIAQKRRLEGSSIFALSRIPPPDCECGRRTEADDASSGDEPVRSSTM